MSETKSIYDIAEEATRRSRAVPYPEMPKAPHRDDFESGKIFGVAVGIYEDEKDRVQAIRRNWQSEQAEVEQWFKTEIAKVLGLEGHPRFDVLFRIAWQQGHSSGFGEVASHCDALAELLRD